MSPSHPRGSSRAWVAGLLLAAGCAQLNGGPPDRYYGAADFTSLRKFDAHVHANSAEPAFLDQARADNFELLSINVDYPDYPPLELQERVALALAAADADRFHYATTFSMQGRDEPGWAADVTARLRAAVARGAVAVKVWKNIGMEVRNAQGELIMIDDPGFDPIFAQLRALGVPLIGHQGEPRNCWLPLDEMTTENDRSYFREHPQYHMYLHPELPSYEAQMAARDRMLARTPGLRFVGAHLASLEWSVDRLAQFLDAHPAAKVDLAARMTQLQYQSQRAHAQVRDFFIRYQDRILYGSDLTFEPGADPVEFRREAHAVWLSHWLYLATGEVQRIDDIDADVAGLQLPRRVIEKMYWTNAREMFIDRRPGASEPR
jgi:predicted TIM-barrel fold metal-dependent hydrolase